MVKAGALRLVQMHPGSRQMPQWEYATIHLNELPKCTDELDLLNDAGEVGWELVSITANKVAYLKRHVAGSAAPSTKSPRRKVTDN